ncbi:sensor histidine kinase [Janthinobacterium sp. BJB1]|uniref:sensor histidine kinase n=1 Tax=Janthinobacterium sp. GW458P TaxID=1981504 RepID=UPI000A320CE1|nr:histidine kinase [Janthinobacterium sp. GW458P]MBE3028053.1 histidine kinase [Janthinobacterium sp. GW458P]PHV14869.1 sensor histidine kinase [Janthinobacterium sp. BJB303]PJC96071.1 sensor histidine kinase [Janthinobacterium sp. BJB1]
MSGPLSKRRGAVAVLLACMALGLALAFVLARVAHAPWLNAALLVVPATLVYAIGTGFSAFYLCRAYPLAARHPAAVAGVMGVAALCAGLLWATLLQFLNSVSLLLDVRWLGVNLTPSLLALFFGLGVLLYCLVAAVHYLLLEFVRARMAEQRGLQAQLAAQEAQLRMLRTQIDPHFLFNSLNSISALTSIDAAGARQMTLQLASFFRQSLSLEAHRKITLEQELVLIRHFLAIEQVRFGARLQVAEAVEADALACLLPPMLIQPLVENAVKHGICNLTEGGLIEIKARRAGSLLQIAVRNPVDADQTASRGTGVGLENVRQRLAGAHGHEAGVHWGRRDGYFDVMISMPARTGDTEDE